MRAGFLPLLMVAPLPENDSTAALTRGLEPFWNVPCTFTEIGAWCFRVRQWKAVVTSPITANGQGGSQVTYAFPAQAGSDERQMCLPAFTEDISSGDGQGQDYTIVGAGFGGYTNSGPSDAGSFELAIGPSTAARIAGYTIPYGDQPGACRIVRVTTPVEQMLFPVLLNLSMANRGDGLSCVLTSFGTEEIRSPLAYNWTGSLASFTFCGHRLPMYYQDKPGAGDFVGAGANGSVDIYPDLDSGAAYYEYRRADGTEPIYDAATGATLLSPIPLYPPR